MHAQTASNPPSELLSSFPGVAYLSPRDAEARILGMRVGLPGYHHDGPPVAGEARGYATCRRVLSTDELGRVVSELARRDEEAARGWCLRDTPVPSISPDGDRRGKLAYVSEIDGEAAGFLLAETVVEGNVHGDAIKVDYCLSADFAYLIPTARGLGLGSGLKAALLAQAKLDVAHAMGRLRDMRFTGTFAASVCGAARSSEGKALLDGLSASLAELVANLSASGLPYAVSCRATTFRVTGPIDDYGFD